MNIDEKDDHEKNIQVSDDTEILNVIDKNDEHETKEKVLLDNTLSGFVYKCLTCDFKTNEKDDIKKHKLSKYSWCSVCLSTFGNPDKLTTQILKQHSN